MLKKLRRKFILVSMLSVFFVLFITVGAINISNYAVIENNSKTTLVEIVDFGAKEQLPPDSKKPDQGDKKDKEFRESYFITIFNEDGSVKEANYSRFFMMNQVDCEKLSLKVFNNELKGRKYEDYRFLKKVKDDGTTAVAFLDIKLELDNARNFLLLSSLISVGAYIVLFGLILFASKIVFKPSEEAYKKQKKFITNASHELKTPLTIISTDLDLIEMDNGKSEWSESIRNQVDRLTVMTKELVDLSRLQEDEPSNYPFEDFSVNEVCNKAIKSFEPSFKNERIKFSYNITGNLTMYGNKHLIDELIYVFLDNSLKYTGGENKSSYFVVSLNNKGKVEFKFSNTVDKDDETDVKQVLERFYRAPSNKKEGAGIGLSIADEIVKLHNGKIKAEKTNNVITFFVSFDK